MKMEKNEKNEKGTVKGKNKKSTRVALCVIILVAIIVVILVVVIKNRNSENSVDESVEDTTEAYVQEIDGGIKLNTSSKLNEAKELDGLTITNVQLTTKDGMTTFLADVINNTGKATAVKSVTITLIQYDGTELISVNGIIDALEDGETTQLNIALTSDYVNAYDFIITSK